MSTPKWPPTASPGTGKFLLTRLILSFNLANALLLLVFLIEGLWVYLWAVWLAQSDAIGWTEVPLSLPSILIVLAASYFGAVNLGRQDWSDRKAHLITGIYLMIVLMTTARFENGGGYGLFDPGWFAHAGDQLANTFFSSLQVTLVGGVYLWRRGYKLAESRIHFDQVFSSFVVGLVAVILGSVLAELALRSSGDPETGRGLEMLITVSFFFAALSALALSHAMEIRGSITTPEDQAARLSTPWFAVLFGVVTTMVAVGWLVALLFSFDVLNPVLNVTFFVLDALLFVVYYVVIVPLGYIAVGLLSLLFSLLGLFGSGSNPDIQLPGPPTFLEENGEQSEDGGTNPWFLPMLRLGLAMLIIVLVVYLLSRLKLRYQRRRPADQKDADVHEMVGSWRDVVRDLLLGIATIVGWLRSRIQRSNPAERALASTSSSGPGGEADVKELYTRLLVESSAAGFPRKVSETPLEYLATLEGFLPTESEAVGRLTHDFNMALYGDMAVPAEEAAVLNQMWQGIYATIHEPSGTDLDQE
ncbi:MAG: DUF4129 domain-containing protein [Chloroflexi bacterium]|nr:DUF4129 domain-containing protein [Chloroflexota bacterium]